MKLSTKGRYAVMAMIDIAQHSDGGPVSLAAIAERQDISQEYLEQLFGKLRKAGIVESARGPVAGIACHALPRSGRRLHHRGGGRGAQFTRCDGDAVGAASRASAATPMTSGPRWAAR